MKIPEIDPNRKWKPITEAKPEELVSGKTLLRYYSRFNELRLGLFTRLSHIEVWANWQSRWPYDERCFDENIGWMEPERVEYLAGLEVIDLDEDDDTCL